MPGKLTRKEIQQDRIRGVLEEIYAWLTDHTAYLAGAIGILAVVVLAGYGWRVYQESATQERQARLAQALEVFHATLQGQESQPEPGHEGHDHGNETSKYRFATAQERNQKALEEFSSLAQDSPGSRTGQLARYYEAIALHELGRSDEAAAVLKGLVEELDEPELSNLARNQLALVLLDTGKREEAIAAWAAILEKPAPNFPRDQLLAQLGLTSEQAGQKQAALDYYRQLVSEFPTAPQTRELERRIDYLEAILAEEAPPAESAPAPEQPSS